MRARALLVVPAVVVTAMLGAAAAPADILFTSASHTTPVPVGTTASIQSGTVTAKTGSAIINDCASSTLNLLLEQNSTSIVSGTLTGGTFSGCFSSAAGDFPWRFTLRGSGVTSGSSTVFTDATWEDISATLWGVSPGNGTLTGATGSPPANGVYVRQASASASSICMVLDNAGTLSGPLLSDGKIDATYCLEGAAATAWSLGATALPPVAAGPNTLFTTAARTTRVTVGATARLTGQGSLSFTLGSSGGSIGLCQASTLTFQLTQNTDAARVLGTITSGTMSTCSPFIHTPTFPWAVAITGGRQVLGSTFAYPNSTITGFRYDSFGGSGTGSLNAATSATGTGLSATQLGGGGICLVMNHAGPVSDSGFGSVNMDGRYCFDGEPASTWSLT